MAEEHVLVIDQDFLGGRYTASCSCGWESRYDHKARSRAVDDWDNHCDVVFMEATGG